MWNSLILGYLLTLTSEVDSSVHKQIYDTRRAGDLFSDFVHRFNKAYNETEYNRRMKIFTQNLEYINKRNQETSDVEFGINKFADIDKREKQRNLALERISLNGSLNGINLGQGNPEPKFCGTVPDQWDWRAYNVVNPPKEQGGCSSCWAFSAIGAIETIHAIKHDELISLSEQQLVDCTQGNNCYGGLPSDAINQAAANYGGGIATEYDYPYEEETDTCRADGKDKPVHVVKAIQYRSINEEQLKALVYNLGPIMLGMQMGDIFYHYNGGIGSDSSFGCIKTDPLVHAILAVGYGIESGQPYWIMKNSYGEWWGEGGFFKMTRGQNTCSILSYVVAAVVK